MLFLSLTSSVACLIPCISLPVSIVAHAGGAGFQNTPYCLETVPAIRDYLLNARTLDENSLYELSLKVLPRATPMVRLPSPSLLSLRCPSISFLCLCLES